MKSYRFKIECVLKTIMVEENSQKRSKHSKHFKELKTGGNGIVYIFENSIAILCKNILSWFIIFQDYYFVVSKYCDIYVRFFREIFFTIDDIRNGNVQKIEILKYDLC